MATNRERARSLVHRPVAAMPDGRLLMGTRTASRPMRKAAFSASRYLSKQRKSK